MSRPETEAPPVEQQATGQSDVLDLRAYVRPIWRWKWMVLMIAILAAAGTYVLTSREQKTYVTSTLVFVRDADPAVDVGAGVPSSPPSSEALQNIATLFTGQFITATVYRQLNLPIGSAGSVTVSPSSSSST